MLSDYLPTTDNGGDCRGPNTDLSKELTVKNLIISAYVKGKLFLQREEGASAVEYAIIAGLIAVAIIGAAQLLGTEIAALFTTIKDALP